LKPYAGVSIEGMEDLQETLKTVMPREAKNILRRTTFAVATTVRDKVKARAPKKTGALMKSIKAKRNKGTRTEMSASVVADRSGGRTGRGFHAHFLEFGTVKMPAQPFIVPTVEEMRSQVPELYKENFGVQYEREIAKRHKKRK
jgi:HK97 gp10 family phage protein